MAEENKNALVACDPPPNFNNLDATTNSNQPLESKGHNIIDISIAAVKEDSDIVPVKVDDSKNANVNVKQDLVRNGSCDAIDDVRSLGDLDSLPVGDDLVLGAAGSDSGVEGCGRALSSGGGSRSCASSVVSCGSGCGSESSSLAGAPPRPRRRVNITVQEPKRSSPVNLSSRPITAPRGPNLATRERARSREKPTPPEKPRPLTPKPKIRPTADLPNLVRESPALRAKPTKTSTARCRTPNSPVDEKKWPTNGHVQRLPNATDASATRVAADKYGTLPRRRRDADPESSPKHESIPPTSRRPTVTRSVSSRSTKTRVRIYAEKTCQTVLVGADIESALAGFVPNIERRDVTLCHRGVQASSRDTETARLVAAVAAAEAAAAEEKERRQHVETQLAAERSARLAAISELERNSQRLLELAGAGAGAGAEGCLRALEEQLRSARELSTRQRTEIDSLREHCDKLHAEWCRVRESRRVLSARLSEAEREAAEMQDFLAAETGALGDSLRDAEAEIEKLASELERRRGECRQLVRMCEQRRQEALAASARARRGAGAAAALDALARRLHALTEAVRAAYQLPAHVVHPTVFHNEAYCSRSDSGETLSPSEEPLGLLGAVSRALRSACTPLVHMNQHEDDRSRMSDDNDNSADLLDSETEPCLVTDPDFRRDVTLCHRGVQASSRDTETARLVAAVAAAEAAAAEEKERRQHVETQLAAERSARLAAISELERNSQRLLELAGAGAGAGAEGCLRALEEQLRSARELSTRQRTEIDSLREHCDKLHAEWCRVRESRRVLSARLSEAEREAAEMQDFLAAETGALGDSLRDAEAEIEKLASELERRRGECRQLVRMCEQRRQEALAASARARRGAGAAAALDALARRLHALTEAVRAAYQLPAHVVHPTVFHNEAYCSRSDSGETLSPSEEPLGLLGAVSRALRSACTPLVHMNQHEDDRSRMSDDNDNSADLLDSETEPCLVTDPEYAEDWWSGAEGVEGGDGAAGSSNDDLSPERESADVDREVEGSAESSVSERESLRKLSAAISRQRWEAEAEADEAARGALLDRVLLLDLRLADLLRALAAAASASAASTTTPASTSSPDTTAALVNALRDKIEVTEKNVADVVVKKLAELEACKNLIEQYQQNIEALKNQVVQRVEEDDSELIEQELNSCDPNERSRRCEAVEAALSALPARPRLLPLRTRLQRLARALAPASPPTPPPAHTSPAATPTACT
nr:uncharacterized protein LOC116767275 [Danaus plexippus plexippus]